MTKNLIHSTGLLRLKKNRRDFSGKMRGKLKSRREEMIWKSIDLSKTKREKNMT